MLAAPLSMVRLEFAKRAEWHREQERRVLDQIRERQEKREREHEAEETAATDFALAMLASDTDIADFTVKLDAYDAATIEALHENEVALAKVQEELRVMHDKAFVLPDGRKVFKTEDGKRIFDESGVEVKDFDPDRIEDWRPRAEGYLEGFEQRRMLLEERRELHDYLAELDEARERTGEDGLTKGELDDLERRLDEDMPDSVKRHLSHDYAAGLDKADQVAGPQAAPFQPAARLGMPTL